MSNETDATNTNPEESPNRVRPWAELSNLVVAKSTLELLNKELEASLEKLELDMVSFQTNDSRRRSLRSVLKSSGR